MASGDPVVQFFGEIPPGSGNANPDLYEGGSTPPEIIPVWDFNDSTASYLYYKARLHGYGNSGLTCRIFWKASTATSSQCRWLLAIRRIADDAEDMDSSHSWDDNGVSADVPTTLGWVSYDSITFTNGADMDSWVDGEFAIIRIGRDPTHGDDGMSGDAELVGLMIEET